MALGKLAILGREWLSKIVLTRSLDFMDQIYKKGQYVSVEVYFVFIGGNSVF